MIETLILKATHRLWNRRISEILCRAYNDRVINSEQLHELTAKFDPTQAHAIYDNHKKRSQRLRMAACAVAAFAIVATLAESASACNRCGLFGRRCRFASVAVVESFAVAPVLATPSVLTIQNNYNAPNGAAAFLAPQGQSVYGLTQAAQPYQLSPDAVLRQAAELTKGAQSLAQQGLNGYNQTASLALTLSATQPAMQAAALTAPQQLNSTRSSSQSIKLTQGVNGQWTVDVSGGAGEGTPTQSASPPAQSTSEAETAPSTPQGPSLIAKHCASCHGQDKPAPDGKLYFDAGLTYDSLTALKAIRAVNNHKMPKKVELPDDVRCAINREIESLTVLK